MHMDGSMRPDPPRSHRPPYFTPPHVDALGWFAMMYYDILPLYTSIYDHDPLCDTTMIRCDLLPSEPPRIPHTALHCTALRWYPALNHHDIPYDMRWGFYSTTLHPPTYCMIPLRSTVIEAYLTPLHPTAPHHSIPSHTILLIHSTPLHSTPYLHSILYHSSTPPI